MALKKSNMLRGCVATVAVSGLLLLAACGGDSSSSKGTEPAEASDIMAETFEDLPVCTDKREGATAYVKDEKTAYTCTSSNWTPDSDENSSSSISGSNPESSASEDLEAVPTSLDGVNGFSQKGPFVKGSSVKVLELESGRTLKQTGRNFDTKIQTDDGHFALNAATMVSQYVELRAEGYYRDEVTGQNSSSPLTLYALTDVTMREGGKVNINLLTHLEYQRVLYLVQKQKMKVSAAKNQAQKEILAILNIDSKGFDNSEDLNIVGTTDADGALLAFSILFQGNRSVADLTSLLQSVASDLEDDGEWNDEGAKADIADWAAVMDLAGELATFRRNVEGWNLGSVPDFEKYVRNFWYTNYGLGECDASNNAEIKVLAKERSGRYGPQKRFVCREGAWTESHFNTAITYGTLTESAERGGQTYRTVTIGEGENAQTWMAENLNYYDATLDGRSWCYGASSDATTPNCTEWGRLYTWAAAVGRSEEECGDGISCNLAGGKVQGICPDGWHIPSKTEWEILFSNVGVQDNSGEVLKSQTGWNVDCFAEGYDEDGDTYTRRDRDTFGFSALPAGYRNSSGVFEYEGGGARFWSSTENNSYNDVAHSMLIGCYGNAELGSGGKIEGFSVRCLKD